MPEPTVRMKPGHQKPVRALAFSPDGRYLASGSDDATVCLWDVKTGGRLKVHRRTRYRWGITAAAFSGDGRKVVSISEAVKGSARHMTQPMLWDVMTGEAVEAGPAAKRFMHRFTALACSEPLDRVALAGDVLWLVDPDTGRIVAEPPMDVDEFTEATAVVFAGRELVSGHRGGGLAVWSGGTGKLQQRLDDGHGDAVTALAFVRRRSVLVSAGADKAVCTWNLQTGKRSKRAAVENPVTCLEAVPLSPQFLSLDSGGGICRWSTSPLSCLGRAMPKRPPSALAGSPDGIHLATGDDAGGIEIWLTSELLPAR